MYLGVLKELETEMLKLLPKIGLLKNSLVCSIDYILMLDYYFFN